MSGIVDIIELRQKRCSLRYGVGACEANGDVKCLQTFETCDFQSAYNLDGELRWYFHRAGDDAPYTVDRPSANDWRGPSIPILQSISTEESRINLGAIREGESPFGLRGTIKIQLADFEFRNQFGDFYASEREIKGSIGSLLIAWLGDAAPQMELYWYRGFKGQTLAQMEQRRYDLINIDPPSNGVWTIEGMDPLHRALRAKAQFPRATDIRLVGDINASTTSITVFGLEDDVSDQFGNTKRSYARINSEIIGYTGYTGSAGEWTLTGVTRGDLGSEAAGHNDNAGVQRVGHFENLQYYAIVNNILSNHTTIDPALIPYNAQWLPEGRTYLGTLRGTGTFVEPRAADEVCGMAMRDGLFSLWWDALDQQIKIKALRQPREAPVLLNEAQHLIDVAIVRRPIDRLTRIVTYYDRGNPTIGLDEPTNFGTVRVRIDAEAEGDNFADGTIRARTTYSAFLRTDANAVLAQATQLQRYVKTPVYITFRVARKDDEISIGDVVQIQSAKYIDRLGNPEVTTWEIIQGPKEIERGLVYEYMAQSFVLFVRPSFIMANNAPVFASATDAQKINACYISRNDGTMPDGTPAYVIQ
jgi:hypothetical protein